MHSELIYPEHHYQLSLNYFVFSVKNLHVNTVFNNEN